ncbi:class I SAM-dependent methyltransferase [Methylocystis parvus]|uniref:Uncharacterized protein n=1 Tax=Methylocystis parvus TaxID=134 RepID=A0A6B8M1D1_9HYPH|nr:class I SAM-dependent methyltransferase [Methylocystis parvus]QGM96095.1 hypothetical protein F7D14_00345 [Methylocystis parvus]WBK00082.1 class I SAM-dependent methyltransferase [Methylocystis parvus OBBP]
MIDLTKRDYWTRYVPFMHPESPAPFFERAFQAYSVRTPAGLVEIKSMLSSYELSILFALAKDYWRGEGAIVDLGCLYGLTTRCFAEGVKLNEDVAEDLKAKRIYAYDLFLAQDYEWWTQGGETIHAGSWFEEFLTLNRGELDYIVPCPGDLLKMNWGAKPIEILMIDAAKAWPLNHFVVSRMFPRLIPGRSVVVQQDYMHFVEYWVAITMEYFADYFQPLDFVFGASGLFLTTKAIPEEAAAFDLSTLSPAEKIRLMDQAISKAAPSGAEVLKTAKAKLLVDLGMSAQAEALISTVNVERLSAESYDDFSGIAQSCVAGLRAVIAQAPAASTALEASTVRAQTISDILFPGVILDNWQMMPWEQISLTGVLSRLRPKGAIEIGVYYGGSLSLAAPFCEKIVAIDIDPEVRDRFAPPPNAEIWIEPSSQAVPKAFAHFEALGVPVNYVLIDADHSVEGVMRDIALVLDYKPREPMLVLMHDSGNPATRQGILSVDWARNPHVRLVDLDFVPGQIIEHSVVNGRGEIWGGLALAYLHPDERTGPPVIRESARMSIACLHHCAQDLSILQG